MWGQESCCGHDRARNVLVTSTRQSVPAGGSNGPPLPARRGRRPVDESCTHIRRVVPRQSLGYAGRPTTALSAAAGAAAGSAVADVGIQIHLAAVGCRSVAISPACIARESTGSRTAHAHGVRGTVADCPTHAAVGRIVLKTGAHAGARAEVRTGRARRQATGAARSASAVRTRPTGGAASPAVGVRSRVRLAAVANVAVTVGPSGVTHTDAACTRDARRRGVRGAA